MEKDTKDSMFKTVQGSNSSKDREIELISTKCLKKNERCSKEEFDWCKM